MDDNNSLETLSSKVLLTYMYLLVKQLCGMTKNSSDQVCDYNKTAKCNPVILEKRIKMKAKLC